MTRPPALTVLVAILLVGVLVVGAAPAPATSAQLTTAQPTTATRSGAPPPDVGYVGDSLGVESQEEILAEFDRRRPMELLAVTNGAYVSWVRRHWLRPILADPPSILVVGLGHGDANKHIPPAEFARQVRAFLREVVPHVDCVRWLDLRRRITYYPPVNERAAAYNRILRQEAARHPEVRVVAYSAWVDLVGNRRFERDRMHLTPVGERNFAELVRQAADSCDPDMVSGPFWDLVDHDPAAPAAGWLRRAGIVRDDHRDGTFRARYAAADVPLVRGDLARWLWRWQGRPTGAPLPRWTDVPFPLWEPVAWVAQRRLIGGLPAARFGPERPVRRGELVRALWRLAGAPAASAPAPWPDVGARHQAAFAWAATEGVVSGFGDGTVRPGAVATRSVAVRALAAVAAPPGAVGAPAPRPALGGPYPPPRRLGGDTPRTRRAAPAAQPPRELRPQARAPGRQPAG